MEMFSRNESFLLHSHGQRSGSAYTKGRLRGITRGDNHGGENGPGVPKTSLRKPDSHGNFGTEMNLFPSANETSRDLSTCSEKEGSLDRAGSLAPNSLIPLFFLLILPLWAVPPLPPLRLNAYIMHELCRATLALCFTQQRFHCILSFHHVSFFCYRRRFV